MIKANVISDYLNWKKIIKKPNDYLNKKLKILSKAPSFKKKNHEFSLLLTNDKRMKYLNFKFRKKNKTTDVLSFPIKIKQQKRLYLGDIAISYEIIKERSKKTNFFLEFDKLWIHGYLHLIGYDHKKLNDFKKMLKKEKLILKYFHKII
ncbi:rRNA maturation RNase YbeY [Candidatus Pelagibacter sp.]|nr:rRNA maturation RNase YbeY [Candidatus Pelagibacter sp.]|tara:strand:+ start:2527 stop:2973 length:447 start_codon:yes stop_codon:yes gene_type:complete